MFFTVRGWRMLLSLARFFASARAKPGKPGKICSPAIGLLVTSPRAATFSTCSSAAISNRPPVRAPSPFWSSLDGLMNFSRGGLEGIRKHMKRTGDLPFGSFFTKAFVATLDWDSAFRTSNDWFDRLGTAMRLPDYLERTAALQKIWSEGKVIHS